MNRDDNEILNILSESFKKEAENTELPEALSKENIVAMLKAQQAKEKQDSEAQEKTGAAKAEDTHKKTAKKISLKKYTGYIAAAAAFAIIIGAGTAAINSRRSAIKADEAVKSTAARSTQAEYMTIVEEVTQEVTNEEGSVVATEVVTDDSGRILTTILSILNEVGKAARDAIPSGANTQQYTSFAYETNTTGAAAKTEETTAQLLGAKAAGNDGAAASTAAESENEAPEGFEHSSEGFYWIDDKDSGNIAYSKLYSRWSDTQGVFIDRVRVHFEYENKGWMVQLSKGQYGFTLIGADIGAYTCSDEDYKSAPDNLSSYKTLTSSDSLSMSLAMYYRSKDDTGTFRTMFSRPYGSYIWCNGFVKGQLQKYSAPRNEVRTLNRITFRSAEMAQLFTASLEKLGFGKAESAASLTDDSYSIDGADVYVLWSDIYTSGSDGTL